MFDGLLHVDWYHGCTYYYSWRSSSFKISVPADWSWQVYFSDSSLLPKTSTSFLIIRDALEVSRLLRRGSCLQEFREGALTPKYGRHVD